MNEFMTKKDVEALYGQAVYQLKIWNGRMLEIEKKLKELDIEQAKKIQEQSEKKEENASK